MRTRLSLTATAAVLACLTLLMLGVPRASALEGLKQFISPSGNIACVLATGDGTDSARCDIKKKDWKMPRPRGCQLDYGDSAEVDASGKAVVTCHGDTTFGTRTKLAYGRSVTLGHFKCSSSTSGITCVNTKDRHGFFISIQKYSLY